MFSQAVRHSIDASNDEPHGKRRRISLACTACRARKSRCDGVRPKCSTCEELSFDCVYKQSVSTSNVIVGKDYLASLEDRLKAVEDSLTAVRTQQARSQQQIRFDDGVTEFTDQPDAVPVTGPSSQSGNGVDFYDDENQDFPRVIDETDSMNAVNSSAEGYCGFFGRYPEHCELYKAPIYSTWPDVARQDAPQLQDPSSYRTVIAPLPAPEIIVRLQIDRTGKVSSPHNKSVLRQNITAAEFFTWFASQTGRRRPLSLRFTFKDAMPAPKSSTIAHTNEDHFDLMRKDIKAQLERAKIYTPGLREFAILVTDPGWDIFDIEWDL